MGGGIVLSITGRERIRRKGGRKEGDLGEREKDRQMVGREGGRYWR